MPGFVTMPPLQPPDWPLPLSQTQLFSPAFHFPKDWIPQLRRQGLGVRQLAWGSEDEGIREACWGRAPESHTAITLANSPRASHASSPQDRPTPELPQTPGPAGHCTPHHWAEREVEGQTKESRQGAILLKPSPDCPWTGRRRALKAPAIATGSQQPLHPPQPFPRAA